jgi:hypothetical protein
VRDAPFDRAGRTFLLQQRDLLEYFFTGHQQAAERELRWRVAVETARLGHTTEEGRENYDAFMGGVRRTLDECTHPPGYTARRRHGRCERLILGNGHVSDRAFACDEPLTNGECSDPSRHIVG